MIDTIVGLIVLTMVASKIVAQYLFQLSIEKGNLLYLWLGVGCYAFLGYLIHTILTITKSLAITNIIASNVSNVLIIIMGWLIFNQTLKPIQMMGIVVVLIGAYMVS